MECQNNKGWKSILLTLDLHSNFRKDKNVICFAVSLDEHVSEGDKQNLGVTASSTEEKGIGSSERCGPLGTGGERGSERWEKGAEVGDDWRLKVSVEFKRTKRPMSKIVVDNCVEVFAFGHSVLIVCVGAWEAILDLYLSFLVRIRILDQMKTRLGTLHCS